MFIILFIISFVSTVYCGLFELAARHRAVEPLWQQVKALERVNTFLEDVQEEIKESRDLLRHINFKNFFNYSLANSSVANDTTTESVNWTDAEEPTTLSTMLPNLLVSLTTAAGNLGIVSVSPDSTSPDSTSPASTSPASTSPASTSPPSVNPSSVSQAMYVDATSRLTVIPDYTLEATPFIREGPRMGTTIIPDVEPEYKEILPYFRVEARPDQVYHNKIKKSSFNKKYSRNKLSDDRIPYENLETRYSKIGRLSHHQPSVSSRSHPKARSKGSTFGRPGADHKRNSLRHASVTLTEAPPYRHIIAVKDYVTLHKKQTYTDKNLRYSKVGLIQSQATRKLKNYIQQNLNEKNVKVSNENENNKDIKQDLNTPDMIFYNKFRNFGQKRFNVVTPPWEGYNYAVKSRNTETKRDMYTNRYKLYNRPTTDIKRPIAKGRLMSGRASNEYLRKITGVSSYSDEETALKVNLLDQLYHYNGTFKMIK